MISTTIKNQPIKMNLQKIAYSLIICIALVVTLVYAKSILIPFILAVLIWFIGREVKSGFDKVGFVKKYFPNWAKNFLSVAVILTVLVFVADAISHNITFLASSLERYQPNIDSIIAQANVIFKLDVVETLKGYSGDLDFGALLQSLFASLTDILSNSFMIILYAVFVLLEEAHFTAKVKALFPNEDQNNRVNELLDKIGGSISNYFRLKILVSIVTGGLSYIALRVIGVDAPEFWALLIFILNFIPTIGSLIGTVFPAIFCLFQFGTFLPSILVLSIVGLIQVLVGNFLEPKLMGSSMNISPLVTILALSIWGAIWGVTGMILSVPITVITIIVFSQFEDTKPIAILLSEKGQVSE